MKRIVFCSDREVARALCTALFLGGVVAGCGASDESKPSSPAPQEAQGNSSDAKPAAASATGAETDAHNEFPDVVFEMAAHITSGEETTKCLLVAMPSDRGEIAVPSAESSYTVGSHHFLVFRTDMKEIPEGGDSVYDCGEGEIDAHTTGSYYEAQSPESRRDLPEGVAHVFKPGEIMLFTSHYVNATERDIDAHLKFTLHTGDRSKVEAEAGSIFFFNPKINLPPHSDMTVTRTCPIPSDMNLALIWPHMHKQGVHFTVTTDDSTQTEENPLYDSDGWADPNPRSFPYAPPMTVHGGSAITYTCTYHNATDRTIKTGQSAQTDEMCILHGMYWPRADGKTESCAMGASMDPQQIEPSAKD